MFRTAIRIRPMHIRRLTYVKSFPRYTTTTNNTTINKSRASGMFENKFNLGIFTCPEGYEIVKTFLGKYSGSLTPGLGFAIPLLHKLTLVNMKTQIINVDRQVAHSSDNVPIGMSAKIIIRVIDAHKALFKSDDPMKFASTLAESSLRAVIGNRELDTLIGQRASIGQQIHDDIKSPMLEHGMNALSVEVTELQPDRRVEDAMTRQSEAERERRSVILSAEADKQSLILKGEGTKMHVHLATQGDAMAFREMTTAYLELHKSLQEQGTDPSTSIDFIKTIIQVQAAQKTFGPQTTTHFLGKSPMNILNYGKPSTN